VPSGDDLLVTIEDNGQGIAPEMLAQIFELFVQGEQGVDRKTGGLGIGLAVAKKLVEAHHGEIMAASEGIGRGSRFSVRLPLVRERTTMDDVPSSALRAAKSNVRRVLLVDDNQDSLEMMQHLLEHLGHTTCTALDGPSAVVACRDFAPDIVFLDIGLPGLSGYDVAAQLRALPGCAHIPIIAVSGYARDADRARAMDAGFTAHVAKPLEMSKLEELVRGA
jgi:CheY-like chemotaxis protein